MVILECSCFAYCLPCHPWQYWPWLPPSNNHHVLHGESITDQASPRTPTQRTFQPQEAVQPQRNQTILQADTPAQKANYSYKRSHPTPLEADAHTSHVHKNAPARATTMCHDHIPDLGSSWLICSYKRAKREKPHSGETNEHAPTQTPCNQPAIAVLTHAQTQHRLGSAHGRFVRFCFRGPLW